MEINLTGYHKKVSSVLRVFVVATALMLPNISAYASHILAMDLRYAHVSGNTYKVTCRIYGDCGPAFSGSFSTLYYSTPEICIYNDTSYLATIHLSLDLPEYVEYICAYGPDSSTCTSTSFPYPGVKIFTYSGTYTLPTTSHNWRFIFDGANIASNAGRAAAITNIASGSTVSLVATLDNTFHNNSNPNLSLIENTTYCAGTPSSYNPSAIDPNGDSLRYDLIAGANGSAVCASTYSNVTYLTGYSGANPLAVTSGTFSFDSLTGIMDFNMNIFQRSLVVYNIREYRNDTFIGSSQREISILASTVCLPHCIDTLPVSVQNVSTSNNILLYPNPASEVCTIQSDLIFLPSAKAEIYDLSGRLLKECILTGKSIDINVKGYATGIYLCKIKDNEGVATLRKLVILR